MKDSFKKGTRVNWPPRVLHAHFACVAMLALACTACPARRALADVEPWADARLSQRAGLVLWLDASAERAARQPSTEAPFESGSVLDVWHDASGYRRDVAQPREEWRPRWRFADGRGFVAFDGEATFLDRVGLQQFLGDFTVFIVAAAYTNDGGFRALTAFSAEGVNDYVSGVTIDQGPGSSAAFDSLNVEGVGFGGAQNLKTDRTPLLQIARLCVTSSVGTSGTTLHVDGQAAGERDRTAGRIALDRVTVGARYYGNGEPVHTQGFFDGEIAEVLVYDRALDEQTRREVDAYLRMKYGDALMVPRPPLRAGFKPLVRVADPPAVQMFVPGFMVRKLPLDLPNINNVLYRDDGVLVALAYNGNIYLLTDTDGDGVEDHAALFWENQGKLRATIGMDLTPAGYPRGRGVFLASKARCLLIADTDDDDRADQEIVVAAGWAETPQGVDALGVAYDARDGSVWFGLGCQDFTNPYVVSGAGEAGYDIASERGTILRVSPDFQRREIFATGLRFPVGIRFNRLGDLFCTDQEGATWLANGNPFDELLHVERGRHYGFPPRHPRYLPNVIDEPSVVNYAPQHQSTCGLAFNEPVQGGPVFGPEWWRADALVAGYSRGKLYRTKLVKTAAGYVGQTQQIAALNMLTADACVTPRGDLVVAAHSGGPDWGSGPTGKGTLYRVATDRRTIPRPVLIWPQTPHEVWIAFDQPLDLALADRLVAETSIDCGPYVAAGDRFESLRPGYAVVSQQTRAGRLDLPVLSAQVTADRRNLILSTTRQERAWNYAVTLPALHTAQSQVNDETANVQSLPQQPQIDLAYDLSGVQAQWQSAAGEEWRGWLPHFDLQVARALTKQSSIHDRLWEVCRQPGTLELAGLLKLRDMLHPAVQPGAKLDHEWPPEQVTLAWNANTPFSVTLNNQTVVAVKGEGDRWEAHVPVPPAAVAAETPTVKVRVRVNMERAGFDPQLAVSFATNEDRRARALSIDRHVLEWATFDVQPLAASDNRDLLELAGGNWARGRQVFLSEEAACAKCHRVRGEGGVIGPDLSNLVERDYASVVRDIGEPSFAINPDYVSQAVVLQDGRIITGTLRSQGDQWVIGGNDGRETLVDRREVESITPSPTSLMPQDLIKRLGPERLRDLLTYLLVAGPRMPDYGKGTPPPPRTIDEVNAVLAGAAPVATPHAPTRALRVVLVAGAKDHGPGEHDYPAWQQTWQRLLALDERTRVTLATDWPAAEDFAQADVLVFYQQGRWTPERAKDIDGFLARGGGLVYIHYAVDGGADPAGFAERIGWAWRGGESKFRHGPLDVSFRAGSEHPVARNLERVQLVDESYWSLVRGTGDPRLLGTGVEEGQERPLFWTTEPRGGRVFVSIPGHFAWTFDDPIYRTILLRGIAWTAREPVDRFNPLVTAGARLQAPAAPPRAAAGTR